MEEITTYVLVSWPESQILMEYDWFDECILMNDENHLADIGSSAYFVPFERWKEL
jgi:hypothetical protein